MINIKLALLSTLFSKKFSLRDEDICHFSLLQSFLGLAGQLQFVRTLIILCTRIPFPYNRMDWNSTVEPLKFKGTVASLDFQEIIIRIDLGIKVSQVTKCSKLQSAPSYTVSPNLKCVLSYKVSQVSDMSRWFITTFLFYFVQSSSLYVPVRRKKGCA